jgi:hypothetical protein
MLKKIVKFAIVAFTLLFVFLPGAILAQEEGDEATPKPIFGADQVTGQTPEQSGVKGIETALSGSSVVSTGSVRELIVKYVNFALPLLALAAFTGFVYAGFLYVTAYGSEEQTGKAKKVMIYAVIGLALVILSYSIVQLFTKSLAGAIN